MSIYTKKSKIKINWDTPASWLMVLRKTVWSLDRSLRIFAFLRNKLFSYVFCRSNFWITTTSPRLLAVKTASKLFLFGHFLATHARQLRTRVRMNLTAAAQIGLCGIIWLQETSLKMIFACEAATAFVLIIFPLSILLSQSNAQFRPSSDAELFMYLIQGIS